MEVIFSEDRESVSVIDFFCCTVYCGNFLFSKDKISYFLYKKIELLLILCACRFLPRVGDINLFAPEDKPTSCTDELITFKPRYGSCVCKIANKKIFLSGPVLLMLSLF